MAATHANRRREPDLVRRQRAIEITGARFAGRVFELGVSDCVILARAHAKAMGHKNIPAPGQYRTPVAAALALRRACVKVKAQGVGIEALLDALLPRIAPAAMLPGDIAMVAREDGPMAVDTGSLVVSVGRKFWGWKPDEDMRFVLIEPFGMPFLAAWRA